MGKTYSEDGDINSTDLIGRLRNHMGFTYMSFILSEKSDSEIDKYIASYESPTDDVNQSLPGDVDGDGVISIADATVLQKYLDNIVSFDDKQLAVADTNFDGSVSVADATQIQKYLANITTSLG